MQFVHALKDTSACLPIADPNALLVQNALKIRHVSTTNALIRVQEHVAQMPDVKL